LLSPPRKGEPMNFSTFGPFPLQEWSKKGLREFWIDTDRLQAESGYPQSLDRGIGVYLFVAELQSGELVPWYVGKTDKSFGLRFRQHLAGGRKLAPLFKMKVVAIKVFVIALVTSAGKLKRKLSAAGFVRSIDRLEFALIGTCLSKNKNLINSKEKAFHTGLHVPGYLNSDPKNYDESALQLAKMLEV
jgi:hypothetical protein